MSLSTKILIWLGCILTFGMLTFIVVKQIENSNRQEAIEKQNVEQKQLIDNIIRSRNEYATSKDIEIFMRDNNINIDAIKNDLNLLKADLHSVSIAIFNSKGQTSDNLPSSSVGVKNPQTNTPVTCSNGEVCPSIDKYGYYINQQKLDLFEDFNDKKIPFGTVGFSAWKDKPWFIDIKGRSYKIVTVSGKDDSQRDYFYNKVSINIDGQNYDIRIDNAETKQEFPEEKFSWFNPHLFLTAGGGVTINKLPIEPGANAGISLGIISYGQFKTHPKLSILQLGLGAELTTKSLTAIINPININMKGFLPEKLVDNTYIGPSLSIDTNSNIFAGLNLSVGL